MQNSCIKADFLTINKLILIKKSVKPQLMSQLKAVIHWKTEQQNVVNKEYSKTTNSQKNIHIKRSLCHQKPWHQKYSAWGKKNIHNLAYPLNNRCLLVKQWLKYGINCDNRILNCRYKGSWNNYGNGNSDKVYSHRLISYFQTGNEQKHRCNNHHG